MTGKRGAPKGNKNAEKHGFYSRAYTHLENRKLSRANLDIGPNNFGFFKIVVSRTMERIKPSSNGRLSFQETVLALHTIILAVNRLYQTISFDVRFGDSERENSYEYYYNILKKLEDITDIDDDVIRESEPQEAMPPPEPVRSPGGQPGNINALKHGLFARHYTREEMRRLKKLDDQDLSDEIALLQVLMLRVFSGMHAGIPLVDYLKAVRTLAHAGACLDRIRRAQYMMLIACNPMEAVYKELSHIPFEED